MLVRLRREYGQLVTSGGQLLLLLVGVKIGTRDGWLVCLAIMAGISLLAWLSALSRLRAVRDTPTSKIASAAQGYIELIGRGRQVKDAPLLSKFTALPCLWYRYTVKRRTANNKWETIDSGESQDCFLLRDETGVCLVDPDEAEIITKHRDQWQKDGYHYTEWKLIEQDYLYVIGQFRTQGGSNLEFDTRAELNALLAEWKKDKPALHARFDLDNNGELDMREWMLARSAARREVAKKLREAQAQPDIHIIGQPSDGKLFLISNITPDRLARRYLFWSMAHLAIFFGALAAIGWIQAAHP
ncbi:MAG TPA: GIDE domain-containing protein [Gallionella sp.]